METQGNIEIYRSEEGRPAVQVQFSQDTVWLDVQQMASLFDRDTDTIRLHLSNIFQSGELQESATTEDSSVVRLEGKRKVKRRIKLYNLDAIISVGYRVNSRRGIQFRQWATQRLNDYLIKGYAINQERLEQKSQEVHALRTGIRIVI